MKMINQKSVLIGIAISAILLFILGSLLKVIGLYAAVFIGAIVAAYLANNKIQLKVVEAALHGIIVGIFTGIIYILITYAISGFSKIVAGILIYFALVLIGGYIIIGALGGVIGLLLSIKYGNKGTEAEHDDKIEPEEKVETSDKK
jgi:hypothetical protein